ncbi:MAG: hypothetical protein EBV06_04065 [Planctomycetia bacterium]|nr:hypothetical protein [Planctomycetia bacterium]
MYNFAARTCNFYTVWRLDDDASSDRKINKLLKNIDLQLNIHFLLYLARCLHSKKALTPYAMKAIAITLLFINHLLATLPPRVSRCRVGPRR